jgi:hypothetical protein
MDYETSTITKPHWWKAKAMLGLVVLIILLATAFIMVGILAGLNNKSASSGKAASTPTPIVSSSVTPLPTTVRTPTPTITAIKVFFSKHPDSDNNTQLVFGVTRNASDLGVARAAFKQLLEGPTTAEQTQKLYSAWTLSGDSTCGADRFTVSLQGEKATIKICQDYTSAGVGQDARAQAEGDATLKQFSSISKTVYLNKDGNCLFDQSGQNLCLQ